MVTNTTEFVADLEDLTPEQAADNILEYIKDGRLVQDTWGEEDADGRRTACLLGSIHAGINSPSKCPGKLMPKWIAELTPSNFDQLDEDNVNKYGAKYADYLTRWGALDDAEWSRVQSLLSFYIAEDSLRLDIADDGPENNILTTLEELIKSPNGLSVETVKLYSSLLQDERLDFDSYLAAEFIEQLGNFSHWSYEDMGEVFFDALFKALDVVLPPQEVEEYTFDVTTEVVVRDVVRVTAYGRGAVAARRVAMESVKNSVEAELITNKLSTSK